VLLGLLLPCLFKLPLLLRGHDELPVFVILFFSGLGVNHGRTADLLFVHVLALHVLIVQGLAVRKVTVQSVSNNVSHFLV
jgi:hypothetical protein